MDTKSKKYRLYTPSLKVVAVVITMICAVTCYIGMAIFFNLNLGYGSSPMAYASYYDTHNFFSNVFYLVNDVISVDVIYKSEEDIKAGKCIDEDQFVRELASNYGIDLTEIDMAKLQELYKEVRQKRQEELSSIKKYGSNSIRSSVTPVQNNAGEHIYATEDADDSQTAEIIAAPRANLSAGTLTEQDIEKISSYLISYSNNGASYEQYIDFLQEFDNTYPTYKKNLIQQQLYEFKRAQDEISGFVNFNYALLDENENLISGNATPETILKGKHNIIIDGPYISGSISRDEFYMRDSIPSKMGESNYKLLASVNDELKPGDEFYEAFQMFEKSRGIMPVVMIDISVSAFIMILMALYLMRVSGQEYAGGAVVLKGSDRIYNDFQTVFVFILGCISCVAAVLLLESVVGQEVAMSWFILAFALTGIIFFVDVVIMMNYLCSMARQFKAGRLFQNTFISTTIRRIGSLFTGKTFKGWIAISLLAYLIINFILIFLTAMTGFMIVVLIAFNILSLYLLNRAINSLTIIMKAARETSEGNINYELDIDKISPSFINFAKDVAGIQRGLKRAVEEAVKGERMKIDLITNVSHDLKTPLTSIVTYVDLLKKEELHNEAAQKYVHVLDEKSNRLKQLIEDLIEASKASSGNLAVTKERVDLRQLVMQACGEFEEKIQNADLNFIVSSETGININADGKHMWRIVENLIGNVIKYSMTNTRVYIDILKTRTQGILVIKNISAQPIKVTVEQLTERFVRGDESRTTEGSGLGLSIAQSLTNLQDGELDISIDGDLFKVCIRMPLWEEPEVEEEKNIDDDFVIKEKK